MPLTARWTAIAESQFPWERDALDYVRERLPDQVEYVGCLDSSSRNRWRAERHARVHDHGFVLAERKPPL